MNWLLVIHLAATWTMTGVIWFAQGVQYPLFARVGAEGFAAFERDNVRRTGAVLAAPLISEVVTAVLLLVHRPASVGAAQVWVGALLLAMIWLSTAIFQVPYHRRLAAGFDPEVHRSLVRSNWVRTIAWTARGCLAAWMVLRGMQ